MPPQGISRHFVWELPAIQNGERRCVPLMFGMAFTACGCGIVSDQPSVDLLEITQLRGDVRMANQTTVIHGLRFPRRSMTGIAVTVNFRMRSYTAQQRSRHCIERTGAKHDPAVGKTISHDG